MSTEDKNKMPFTAGNNLTGIFKLYHEAMMKNELKAGLGAYELNFAGGKSGFSFGGNQIDLSKRTPFAANIVDILKNATDSKGVSFFTQDEVLNIAGEDNGNLIKSKQTLQSVFGDNLPPLKLKIKRVRR